MPKILQPGTPGQESQLQVVLGLLSFICQVLGHTFSWYTSQKGRTWLAFKNNHGIPYSTNAEYAAPLSEKDTLGTLAILMQAHIAKALEIAPPTPTWHGGKHTAEDYAAAWETLRKYIAEAIPSWQEQGLYIPPPIVTVLGSLDEEPTT